MGAPDQDLGQECGKELSSRNVTYSLECSLFTVGDICLTYTPRPLSIACSLAEPALIVRPALYVSNCRLTRVNRYTLKLVYIATFPEMERANAYAV